VSFFLYSDADVVRLVAHIRALPRQRDGHGITYKVTIAEQKPTRSAQANARYWALLTAISQQAPEYMGGQYHSPKVWHEYLSGRFLGFEAGPYGTGGRKSTADMKVGEFAAYMEQIEAWASHEFVGWSFEWEEAA